MKCCALPKGTTNWFSRRTRAGSWSLLRGKAAWIGYWRRWRGRRRKSWWRVRRRAFAGAPTRGANFSSATNRGRTSGGGVRWRFAGTGKRWRVLRGDEDEVARGVRGVGGFWPYGWLGLTYLGDSPFDQGS